LVAAPLLNLAEFELRRGEVARAKPYLERGRRAAAALGPGHSMAAYAEGLVAKLAFAEGDVDGADAAFRRGLETMERARGPGNAETADFLLGLGLCAERRGRVAEAKQQLTLSLSRLDRATVTPYSRAEGHLALARLALAEGELETSRSLLAQVRVDLTTLGAMGQRLAQEAEVVASGLQ
jgi:ATP/maltotriose-dependent transcriptional regulator MalT